MFAIIGIVVVFGAVLGGYLMEHGNVKVSLIVGYLDSNDKEEGTTAEQVDKLKQGE